MKKITLHSCWRFLSLIPLLMFANYTNGANIYAFIDGEGRLLVSDKKNDARYVRFEPKRVISSYLLTRTSSRVTPQKAAWMGKRAGSQLAIPIHNKALQYASLINGIAIETGVNANLLHAIIQVESAYNPGATSPKGAQGLMQLIPATATRFGVEQSYDPEANVRGGARYIKNLLARFNNDLQLALAAYNAGEGSVQEYNNTIPPYPETQAYVSKVLSLFKQRELTTFPHIAVGT